jgi:hypothetical protein
MPFFNFWYELTDFLKGTASVLVIAGAFAGIIITLYFSIFRLSKKHHNLGIIFSTIVSCVLMVPVITSFNYLAALKVEGKIIDESKAEIKAQREQIERLKAENKVKMLEREKLENEITIAKQSIEIEALSNKNMLLERAKLSMQSFQQIAELALTQANFKQTLVKKEPVTSVEAGWGLRADYHYDEILVVSTHDINAKFGVDLKDIKIAKQGEGSVAVSGIRPKFIGADKNLSDTVISEIRRNNYKNGALHSVDRKNDKASILLAENKRMQYETEFQLKVSEGIELAFMDNAIVQLAQNFIKIVLSPLYDNIAFETAGVPEALPFLDYLTKELKENNEEKYKLLRMNEQMILRLDHLETEIENQESGNDV